MHNVLDSRFAESYAHNRRCLVPYVTAGFPSIEATVAILRAVRDEGVGAIELGIPFTDPIADGPVIQGSFYRALDAGFSLEKLWSALASARRDIPAPLVAMVTYSIVYRRGVERFAAEARRAGIDGLIVPDLAHEETDQLIAACGAAGLSYVPIVAPTATLERQSRIASRAGAFVYYQAVAGITGERASLPVELAERVAALRSSAGKPVCVGFGISQPEQVREVCAVADGAIVGSAIVRRITAAVDAGDDVATLAAKTASFIHELADATQLPSPA